jgi:hypothetical protein
MLELATIAVITASSLFLFGFWCYQAYHLMRGSVRFEKRAEIPTRKTA